MLKPKSFLKLLTKTGPMLVLAVVLAVLVAAPASAQFFNFNFGGWSHPAPRSGGGFGSWFGHDFFRPPAPQQAPKRVYQDFSKAPPPEKRETAPTRNILVLGDGMADWLAYGLEDAYSEQPDIGVIRKAKANTGLIRYQFKGEPADWPAAAKGILANEKPDVIVVMLGLSDRLAIHEPPPDKEKPGEKKNEKNAHSKPDAKSSESKSHNAKDGAGKPDDKAADNEVPQDELDTADAPIKAPEKAPRSPNGVYEFRDERWIELYDNKIDEMIAAVKAKGVPVVWVGLPAIRGTKGTADMLFLDSLYRDAAGRAGITYVDVWDGFVDEAGRFLQKGPDFEGQIRQLRTYDGVYFTKPGARKLAHYVEREVTRLLAARSSPIALPTEPATPEANAVPGQPAPRPLAGPILPLVASSIGTDQLLGGPGTRPAPVDALVARTLVKGESLTPPAGRADDFAWPRREVESEPVKGDTPVASTSPASTPSRASSSASSEAPAAAPRTLQKPKKPHAVQPHGPSLRSFFGFGAPRQPPRAPATPGVPRPPTNVGRSASVPDYPMR